MDRREIVERRRHLRVLLEQPGWWVVKEGLKEAAEAEIEYLTRKQATSIGDVLESEFRKGMIRGYRLAGTFVEHLIEECDMMLREIDDGRDGEDDSE